MNGKVVRLKGETFHKFMDDVRDKYDSDVLNHFICIYDYKPPKKEEGIHSEISRYWFARSESASTVYCLGLLEEMKDSILEYMREE